MSIIDAPPAPAPARPSTGDALPVHLRGVGRSFGEHTVLADVDLDIEAGEVIAVLGPSGCGKSTLLRLVAGLESATRGTVSIGDTQVRGLDRRCGVGFQEPRLLPWRTVRKNVLLGVPRGTPTRQAGERVDELLHLVGLDRHAEARPRQISGGMAQRASLARALARRPGVLLLDEPFGALDALTRLRMQELLLTVHRAHPSTVLLVTHDVDEALRLADRIVVLGQTAPEAPATVLEVHRVPAERLRADDDPDVLALRHTLLAQLGVHTA